MMKELYISPEAKLLCFAPAEKLASNSDIAFEALLDGLGGVLPVSGANGDIDLDLTMN